MNWLGGLEQGSVLRYEVSGTEQANQIVTLNVAEKVKRGEVVAVRLVPGRDLPPSLRVLPHQPTHLRKTPQARTARKTRDGTVPALRREARSRSRSSRSVPR